MDLKALEIKINKCIDQIIEDGITREHDLDEFVDTPEEAEALKTVQYWIDRDDIVLTFGSDFCSFEVIDNKYFAKQVISNINTLKRNNTYYVNDIFKLFSDRDLPLKIRNSKKSIKKRYFLDNLGFFEEYLQDIGNDQFRIIRKEEDNENIFNIDSNDSFYNNWEKETNLLKFLKESKKVSINPDIDFIPLRLKKKDNNVYILITNNLNERMELYQLKSFLYFNKQSNIHYILQSNLHGQFLGDYNNFERYLVKSLQNHDLTNSKLLNQIYKGKLSNFEDDSKIIKQY